MPCFYVYAPLYQKNSNGIRILYTLSELIREQGCSSKVICFESDRDDYDLLLPTRYKNHTIAMDNKFKDEFELNDQDIVIYPETISGNPLEAKNVVRYLLNRPIYLSSQAIQYKDTDYLVSYSLQVDSNLPQLFILNDDSEYFYPLDFSEKDNLVSLYYGKAMDAKLTKEILYLINSFKQQVVITREFPRSRTELGELLRRSRLLISLDPISNITYEATLCGTPALIVKDIFNFSNEKFNIPLHGIFNNPTSYDESIKDAKFAFNEFKGVIEQNKERTKEFILSVLKHFELMAPRITELQSILYVQSVASRNNSQREIDELRYMDYLRSLGYSNSRIELLKSQGFSSFKLSNSSYFTPVGRAFKNIIVLIGIKRFFGKWYLNLKNKIQSKKFISRLFYRF